MTAEEELRYDMEIGFNYVKIGGWYAGAVGASETRWRMGIFGKFLSGLGELPVTKEGYKAMDDEIHRCLGARSRMVQPPGLTGLVSAETITAINTPGNPLNPLEG